MPASGELIRLMNYVDDINATLRRISSTLATITEEERKRLSEYMGSVATGFADVLQHSKRVEESSGGDPRPSRSSAPASWGAESPTRPRSAATAPFSKTFFPTRCARPSREIRANLDKAVELGKVTAGDADAAFSRLEFAGSVDEAARQADLVIEAVPEEMESKIEIFTLLDKICRPTTILASNTCSLSLTEIASVTYRAKKIVGMHFFNPVHKMKLLEIVRALETDDETLATAVEVGKRMGKEVVVIKESPGFITSRINAMIGNEAFYMLQEGVASCGRHRQSAEAWAESSHGAVRAGGSRGPRHAPAYPRVPAQDAGREISPGTVAGAVCQGGTSGAQVWPRRIRLSRADGSASARSRRNR